MTTFHSEWRWGVIEDCDLRVYAESKVPSDMREMARELLHLRDLIRLLKASQRALAKFDAEFLPKE